MPEGFRIATAWVSVSPDTEGFREELQGKLDEATAGAEGRVRVGLDAAEFDAKADEVKGRLEELSGKRAEPSLHLESSEFDAKADDAKAKLDRLSQHRVNPKAKLDTAEFDAKADEVEARLRKINAESARPRIGASGAGGAGGAGHGGGEGGGIAGLLGEHGLMAGIVGGITGLLPGVSGGAMGAGLLGGAGVLALGGVGKAIQDAHQASLNIGMTPQQVAATQFSNQVQRQDAGEQVTSARMQSAQDAITAARSIESAQMNLASVERNTAAQQVQALQSVVQAQQGAQQADYALSEAQYNLNQAWERAKENLRQLDDQLNDSKLNVQQAQLAIKEALYQQRLTDQNAYSTSIDREQAALAVARAQQGLVDAQDQLTTSQYKANLANKEGIDGSQEIIQAKQAVVASQYGQTDAQAQYAIAQVNLTNTELNNAAQIKEARMQLAAAEQDAAHQRQMDARSVALAERNVGNVVQEQQLQWAAMKSTENEAANQLAKDLSRMTPAMRGVVEQILGMSGALDGMKQAAQDAVAPGLSAFVTGLSQNLPAVTSGVSQMGSVIGQAFGSIGKALQSQAGQGVLQGLIDNGVKLAQTVVPAVTNLGEALAKLGSQKGAADGLAGAFGGILNGVTMVVQALTPFTGVLSTVFGTLGQALAPIGSLLGTLVGGVAQALAPALQALLPAVTVLAGALGQGLTPIFQALGPMLLPVAQAVTGIVQAFSPLLPVIGGIVGKIGEALTPLLQALMPVVTDLAKTLSKDLSGGLMQTLTATMPLLPILVKLIDSLLPIIDIVIKLAGVLIEFAAKMTGPVIGAVVAVIGAILNFVASWRNAVTWVEEAAMWLWHNVFDPLWHGIQSGFNNLTDWFKGAWDIFLSAFKDPVKFLIKTVYDDGIAALWNHVADAIGKKDLELPIIQTYATGGIVPGRDGGKDTVPAMLRPEEGVLVPEAVRGIGGPGMVHALNAKYGGGRPGTDGYHFSSGGIIGSIGGFVSGLVGDAIDFGKITAALATGNGTALNNALNKLVSTPASGGLAQLMIGAPTALIQQLVNKALSAMGATGSVGGTIPSGGHLAIIDAALQAAGVPPPGTPDQWRAGLNTLIGRESGWNPRAINLTDINAQNGDPSRGLAQTIMSTFLANHVPGTSGDIYDPVANVAAAVRYIVGTYGNITKVQQANANLPSKGYDSGGWLMPGNMPVNGLSRPEAVLTPQQSDAFVAIVRHLTSQGMGGSALGGPVTVEQHYHGTQWPTAEHKAAMQRDLALALGGAS